MHSWLSEVLLLPLFFPWKEKAVDVVAAQQAALVPAGMPWRSTVTGSELSQTPVQLGLGLALHFYVLGLGMCAYPPFLPCPD